MSRYFLTGFGLAGIESEDVNKSGGTTDSFSALGTFHGGCRDAGRFPQIPGNTGLRLDRVPSSGAAVRHLFGGAIANRSDLYQRFYFRVRRRPTTGEPKVWSCSGSTGTVVLALILKTTGELWIVPYDGAQLSISSPLVVNQWYRVEVYYLFDVAGGGDTSRVTWKIDGVTIGDHSPVGFRLLTGSPQLSVLGALGSADAFAGGFDEVIDYADWVADDTEWVGDSRITMLEVKGAGTYNEFSDATDAPFWQNIAAARPQHRRVNSGANAGALNERQTYLLQTPREAGITGNIKCLNVIVHGSSALSSSDALIIRQNGVDTIVTSGHQFGGSLYKFYPDGSGWGLDDVIEVGVRAAGAGSTIATVAIEIEHDTAAPPAITDNEAHSKVGSFVGAGAVPVQVDCGWKPSFVLALRLAGGGGGDGALYFEDCGGGGVLPNSSELRPGILPYGDDESGGFYVCGDGGALTINVNAQTYVYVAFRDPFQRLSLRGGTQFAIALTPDNQDVTLSDATFTPEWLFALETYRGGIGSRIALFQRTPAHVGDSSSQIVLNAAVETDAIQSMGAGTFQVGTKLSAQCRQMAYCALRTNHFFYKRLFTIESYVGDNTNGRSVSLNLGGATPEFVIVLPHSAAHRHYRSSTHTGANSTQWSTGTVVTNGIVGFGADAMTVDAGLNAIGVTYSVLAFVTGDDLTVQPEVTFPSGGIGEIGGIFWAEFTDRAGGLHIWTHKGRELPDPSTYFGGFKEGRVIKGLPIRRALSDRQGQYEGLTFGVRLSDEDRSIRSMLSTTATKTFINCTLVERMIADDDRRLLRTPRTVGRGLVRSYSTDSPLTVELHGEDTLAVRFASASRRDQLPNRLITVKDFPNAGGELTEQASGSTKPIGAVDLPVPIVYGAMSNRLLQNVQTGTSGGNALTLDPNLPDAGVESPANANGILGASTFAVGQGIRYALTVVKAGLEGPFSRIIGTMNMENPGSSHTALSFEEVPGVDSYRVYMFDGWFNPNTGESIGNTFVRFKTHDNVTVDGFFGHKYGVEFFGPTDGTDFFGAPTTPTFATKDVGTGACPFVYCGQEAIGASSYHVFLIAGHAITAVEEIYLNEVAIEIATPANRAAWLIPGFDGRPLYEVRNGHRYAIVYGKVGLVGPDTGAGVVAAADNKVGLGFGVQGIEDVGDGTGALITSALQQYKHAFINWILQTYDDGAWLTTPAFTDDATLPQVDEDSFDTADGLAQARYAGGYVGAFVIGANGERLSARDLIARFNLSCDVDAGFNRKCQWMVSMIDERPAALTVGTAIFDTVDIKNESFDSEDEVDQLFNHLAFKWSQDYTGASSGSIGGFVGSDEIINQTAEDEVREEKLAPEVDFYMLRDAAIARDIAERRLNRVLEPPRLVKFVVPLIGLNFELGDVILLTHYSGIGPNGWVNHPIRIVRMETDPDSLSVYVEGYDLQRFVDFLTEKGTGKYGDLLASFSLADTTGRLRPVLLRAQLRRRPLLWTRAAIPTTLLGTIDRTPDAAMTPRRPIPRRQLPPRTSGTSAAASSARINLGPTAEEP